MPILSKHHNDVRPLYRIRMFDKEDNPVSIDPDDTSVRASSVVEALQKSVSVLNFRMATELPTIWDYHKVVKIGASKHYRVLDEANTRTWRKEYIDEYSHELFLEIDHA